jgi:SAM-dependent methyltransferase
VAVVWLHLNDNGRVSDSGRLQSRSSSEETKAMSFLDRVVRWAQSIGTPNDAPSARLPNLVFPRNSDFIPYIRSCLRPEVVTVLDVGCGKLWDGNSEIEDYLLTVFSSPAFSITGTDIFAKCIEWRKENGPPGEYVQMDAMDIAGLGRQFDLVICHHVIEHFDKETSRRLVRLLESLAAKQVIIGAPVGFTDTEYAVKLHENEFERHKCGWTPEEFVKSGYSVVHVYAGAFLVSKIIGQDQSPGK